MSLMTLEPCISLSFDGQCEAAFKFYERCLNGKITFILTWGDLPAAEDVPTEWRRKVAHAAMVVAIPDCRDPMSQTRATCPAWTAVSTRDSNDREVSTGAAG